MSEVSTDSMIVAALDLLARNKGSIVVRDDPVRKGRSEVLIQLPVGRRTQNYLLPICPSDPLGVVGYRLAGVLVGMERQFGS